MPHLLLMKNLPSHAHTNGPCQALLVIDHQVGLAQLVRDYGTNDFRNNMLAHAAVGNVFDLPTVLTTSSDTGPNGLLLKEIRDMHPNATLVQRQGEVNAWDNEEFRAAVRATGKKQLIIGGIVTEVCTSAFFTYIDWSGGIC